MFTPLEIEDFLTGQARPCELQMTIGIPRALFYWKRPHFWPAFFEDLGFKILLSPSSNKEIIEKGIKAADPETCFSVKVLYGHILWLAERADFIFIPRLKRIESKLEYCPKFFALPDLFPLLVKTPILSPWIDLFGNSLENILLKFGKEIGKEKKSIEKAIKAAFLKEKEEEKKIANQYFKKIQSPKKKIVLVSHPYNLYDEYVNLRIKDKIEGLGGEVILIDEVPISKSLGNQEIFSPKFHWEFGQEMISQCREVISSGITGAIEISAFQCGCDAVLKEFIEREFKNKEIPFLYLLIDEHTAEAGLQTRLEAFFDTLQ
jgi:predicted nucleotide-binding protein (sugar kinase/HSP70/actin superfamily)